jgi:hypothetical protein
MGMGMKCEMLCGDGVVRRWSGEERCVVVQRAVQYSKIEYSAVEYNRAG